MWIKDSDLHNSVAWICIIRFNQGRGFTKGWAVALPLKTFPLQGLFYFWLRSGEGDGKMQIISYIVLPGKSSSKSVSYSELASLSNMLWNEGEARVVTFWSSSDSGRDTIVETEPGMREPALKPVRRRGSVDLSLSTERFVQVWDVEPSPCEQ